jgi:hypothetical protein
MSGNGGLKGEGAALAFCVGGAFAAQALAPATRFLDLKAAGACACAAAASAGLLFPSKGLRRGRPSAWAFSAALVALAAWALAYAAAPWRPAWAAFDFSVPAALVFGFALAYGPQLWRERLPSYWRWAVLAVAVWALAQHFGLDPWAEAQGSSPDRASAGFGNPGYLAAFLCLSWPLFLLWPPTAAAPALLLVFAALVATQSRAALAAAALQASLLAVPVVRGALGGGAETGGSPAALKRASTATGPARRRLGLVGLCVLAGIGALALGMPRAAWLRPTLRLDLWKAALDLWLKRPLLGWGPGNFVAAFERAGRLSPGAAAALGWQYPEDPHQMFLAVACAAGWVGVVALAFSGCVAFELARRGGALAAALGLGLLGVVVEAQADRFFFQPGVLLPVCAAFALMASESAPPVERRGSPVGRAKFFLVAAAAAFFAWRAAATVEGFRTAVAERPDVGVEVLRASGPVAPPGPEDGADAWDRWAGALAAEHRYAEAASAYAAAWRIQPDEGRAQNLGDCAMMLGRPGDAEKAFRDAVALAPRNSDAHFSLAYALYDQKRLAEALAELDEALKLDPGNASALELRRQIAP